MWRRFSKSVHTGGNAEGIRETLALLQEDFCGLCFVNLVDFDMVYGHRRNALGYAEALSEADRFLGRLMDSMREEDLLIVTADHGTDPGFFKTTDHTREDVPFLAYRHGVRSQSGGHVHGFGAVANTISAFLGMDTLPEFASFASLLF